MAKKTHRWETGRDYVRHLLPSLPSPAYVAVVMVCWFHGRSVSQERNGRIIYETEFNLSAKQIGEMCQISPRYVRTILADMERAGCFKTLKTGAGNWPSQRVIKRVKYIPSPPCRG